MYQHVNNERIDNVDQQVQADISSRVQTKKIILQQKNQLHDRLAEIKTNMPEHCPGILAHLVSVAKDLAIHIVPQRRSHQASKEGEDDNQQQ